jgi:hypothetical protein
MSREQDKPGNSKNDEKIEMFDISVYFVAKSQGA